MTTLSCGHLLHPIRCAYGCADMECQFYAFRDERDRLGRPRPTVATAQQLWPPRRKSRYRLLKPSAAVVRYNDGSQYTLANVVAVRRPVAGGYQVIQALPGRTKVDGVLEHFIPGHNVDVLTWRRREWPSWALESPHEHCPACGGHHAEANCPTRVRGWRRGADAILRLWRTYF